MSQAQNNSLTNLWISHRIICSFSELISPGQKPLSIDGLVVVNGFCCNFCDYRAPASSTFEKHWLQDHPDISGCFGPSVYRSGLIQCFFRSHQRWFEVKSCPTSGMLNAYSLYCEQIASKIPPLTNNILSPSNNKISPLLQEMGWYQHLGKVTKCPALLDEAMSWMAIPTKPTQYWKDFVKPIIMNYLMLIRKQVLVSVPGVHVLLMHCPRYIRLF